MKIRLFLINLLILFFANGTLLSQGSGSKEILDKFIPDFHRDGDMKILKVERNPLSFSYGGWITSVLIDERNGIVDGRMSENEYGRKELQTSITIGKIWMKGYLWKNNFLYIRARDVYFDVLRENGIDIENCDNTFDLDVCFFSFSNQCNSLRFFLGRKFFIIGTGLILNGRADGVELDIYSRYLDIKLIGSYTGLLSKDNNPYYQSNTDFSEGARRIFAGCTLSRVIYNQTLYLLGLIQIDRGKEPADKKTRYSSEYYGAGFKGVYQNAFYFGEFIHEQGESYLNLSDDSKPINAFAALFGLNYYVNFIKDFCNSVLMIRYFYGSGDGDRISSKSSTGNLSGRDNGFLYFGSFSGGYALRPLLSNIHIFRAGLSISPFSDSKKRLFRRVNLISKYSYYLKDRAGGVINYGEATENSRDLGHGLDVALRWNIFYDFSFFLNYGLFVPGRAYSSEGNRNFIMGGVHISI